MGWVGPVGRPRPMAMQRRGWARHATRCAGAASRIWEKSGLQDPCFILEGASKHAASPPFAAETLMLARHGSKQQRPASDLQGRAWKWASKAPEASHRNVSATQSRCPSLRAVRVTVSPRLRATVSADVGSACSAHTLAQRPLLAPPWPGARPTRRPGFRVGSEAERFRPAISSRAERGGTMMMIVVVVMLSAASLPPGSGGAIDSG